MAQQFEKGAAVWTAHEEDTAPGVELGSRVEHVGGPDLSP